MYHKYSVLMFILVENQRSFELNFVPEFYYSNFGMVFLYAYGYFKVKKFVQLIQF